MGNKLSEEDHEKIIVEALQSIGKLTREQAAQLQAQDIDIAALGLDSVSITDFCMALEERIGREIEVDELIENPSIKGLARHLSSKG